MADNLIRIYKILDAKKIKPNLLVHGDLSCTCANCSAIDIPLNSFKCPKCNTDFQYIAFRNIKTHIPKIHKLFSERSEIVIIDFDDYKRNEGAIKAEEFLK